MPVISFANPKGGAGKTTAALLLAGELAAKGARVCIVDADPERWISQWGRLPGRPEGIEIAGDATEESIVELIEQAERRAQFVVVDLEGTASLMVAHAIGMSDLVLIPVQGSAMDARGAAKTVRLIRNQGKMARRSIAHAVVLTRTSAAVPSRALRHARAQLDAAEVPVMATSIVERAAFRDLFDYGGTLAGLDPARVSNVDKAIANARRFAGKVLTRLRAPEASMPAAPAPVEEAV
jgi:chromosome partitioning protein